jgi:hypothetical protein
MRLRLKTPHLIRNNQNAWTEDARVNRFANFRLRHELGTLTRVRHAASFACLTNARPHRLQISLNLTADDVADSEALRVCLLWIWPDLRLDIAA